MFKRTLLLLLTCFVLFAPRTFAQLFEENFNYAVGDTLTTHGYLISSGGTTNAIRAVSPGLTYTGYPSSGIGQAAYLDTTGQDVYKYFPADSVGSVYLSFMLNAKKVQTGDYFIALSASGAQTNYYARLFVKTSGAGYVLGISKSNETAVYGTTVFSDSVNYLVVVKYKFNTASNVDDAINVYVFSDPTLPSTEPLVPEIGPYTTASKNDINNLGIVTLRQGGSTSAPKLVIDGIRIGATWSGTVLGQPYSVLSKNTVTMGNVSVGTSKSDTVTVYNIGASALNITNVASTDPTFVVVPTSGTIAPLDSLKFGVTYTPVATGNNSSTITFTNNTAIGSDVVTATGSGVQAGFSATPGSLAFGSVFKDSTKTDTITVSNASTGQQLVIDSVRSSNPLFVVTPTSGTVDTASSLKFAVTFSPVAAGAQSGNIVFYHNAPSLHDTVKVGGTGILREGLFSASKSTIAFPHVMLGDSMKDSVLVKNVGYDSLLIITVASTSPQFIVSPTAARLDTGATQMFHVTYTPVDSVAVSASLVFTHNGSKTTDTVKVSGLGGLSVMTIADARIDANHDFQPDRVGQTVVVIGVVNSINVQGSNSFMGYFIQDSTGGLEIFAYSLGPDLRPGYRVRATGVIAYYRGTTELTPANPATDVVVLDSNNVIIPIQLTIGQLKANPELYESRRIQLRVVAPLFDASAWPAAGVAANLNIWDGRDTLTLRVENESNVGGSPFPNFPVTLTGTETQFTSLATVYNNGYQITPSFITDFTPINAPPLSTFHLLSPANSSRVELDDTAQVVPFVWQSALDFNSGDTLIYHWAPVGFTEVLSGHAGKDDTVKFTGKQILLYLGSADSVDLKWTVNVSDGVNPTVTSVDTLTVRFIRGTISGVNDGQGIPHVFALDQNYPNPFNPTTTIRYALPHESRVSLKVYSLLGAEVATLVDEIQGAKNYTVSWAGTSTSGQHLASGVYFYRLVANPVDASANPFIQVKKMLLLK